MFKKLTLNPTYLLVLAAVIAILFVIDWNWFINGLDKTWGSMLVKYRKFYPAIIASVLSAMGVLLIELALVKWDNSSLKRLIKPDKTAKTDILMWMITVLKLDFFFVFTVSMGVIVKLRMAFKDIVGIDAGIIQNIDNIVLQNFIYILIIDFLAFAIHAINHKVRLLWVFHKFHHAATEMNVITSSRQHPLQNEWFNKFLFLIPLAIVGFPLQTLLIFQIFRDTLTYLHHSSLKWSWGWFGTYVFYAPIHHRVHHSVSEKHMNKNFGSILTIWDHLFGTFYNGEIGQLEVGVPDNHYNKKSFVYDLLLPFKELKEAYFPDRRS